MALVKKTSDISLGELNVSPTTTTKEDNTGTARTVCDRIEYSDRTSLGSFWPEPDRTRTRITSLKQLTGFEQIGQIFTGVKIILTLNLQVTNINMAASYYKALAL